MRKITRIVKTFLSIFGLFFLIIIFIAFTSIPYHLLANLSAQGQKPISSCDYIVVMGGSGMPGESGLIRCYYAAILAQKDTNAMVIIALPGESNKCSSSVYAMKKDLMQKGISEQRILIEPYGLNTRDQALKIANDCAENIIQKQIAIVTSPEHIKRTYLCFKKVGFENVYSFPAMDTPNESTVIFKEKDLGGNKLLTPDIGNKINLRYRLWTHLEYIIDITREYCALSYYKLKGWI